MKLAIDYTLVILGVLASVGSGEPEPAPQFFYQHGLQPIRYPGLIPIIYNNPLTSPVNNPLTSPVQAKKALSEPKVEFYAISRSDREFWDEFYTLHNKYRDDNNLGELHVDVNIEQILKSAGYATGHGHSARQRLNDYAGRVTATTWQPEALENFASSTGYKMTPAQLLAGWKKSGGHNRTILGQKGPTWDAFGCAMGQDGYSFSYLCGYREKGTCGSVSYERTAYGSVSYLRCADRNCC